MKKTLFSLLLLTLVIPRLMGAEGDEEPTAEEVAAITLPPEEEIAQAVVVERNFGPRREDEANPRVLRDFIESRSLIQCRQKCGQLTLAGDVRARWTQTGESVNDVRARGAGTRLPITRFRSEFNLFIDYVDPKSWVSTKVKWAATMGVDGGTLTRPDLDRAFIGYDVYECGEEDFYIELGRSRLEYIFDSRVEFSSFFDGIHLFYTDEWNVGQFVIHGGPFVIDSKFNHYGWVMETFIDDWWDTGIVLKYSFISWQKRGTTVTFGRTPTMNVRNNPRYRFMVSQMLFGYVTEVDFCRCKTLNLYAAVLANHAAQKCKTTHGTYANKAFYLGFTLGKLCKAFDWSLDINYQYVQAQALPEFDLAGIGHGNGSDAFFFSAIIDNKASILAQGFTNFKGLQVSLLYALTDTFSLRTKGEFSTPIDKDIGGDFFYKNFEISAIYAF